VIVLTVVPGAVLALAVLAKFAFHGIKMGGLTDPKKAERITMPDDQGGQSSSDADDQVITLKLGE
jgi:hypothetical protein